MIVFKINDLLCKGCGLCVSVCPKKLIEYSDVVSAKGYRMVKMKDAGACIACAACARMCPDSCIEIYKE